MVQQMTPLASPIARFGSRSPRSTWQRCRAERDSYSKSQALHDLRAKGAGLLSQMGLPTDAPSLPSVSLAAWSRPPGLNLPFDPLPPAPCYDAWTGRASEEAWLTTKPMIEKEPMKVQLPEDAKPLSLTLDPRLPAKKRVPKSIGELCDPETFKDFEPASVKVSESLLRMPPKVCPLPIGKVAAR